MNITFSVRFPVEARTVPAVRGLLRQALAVFRVNRSRVDEIVLAVTEACANVLQHAGEHDEYQVDVAINDQVCRISVVDHGEGFDVAQVSAQPRNPLDGGRGLLLMRALVDRLDFRAEDGGHRVILEKRLVDEPKLRLLSPG